MADFLGLALRCEQASGPDRDLDYDIQVALGGQPNWYGFQLARYTSSFDAAISLAPEGWSIPAARGVFSGPRWGHGPYEAVTGSPELIPNFCSASASTPMLAIAAACLRARASTPSERKAQVDG